MRKFIWKGRLSHSKHKRGQDGQFRSYCHESGETYQIKYVCNMPNFIKIITGNISLITVFKNAQNTYSYNTIYQEDIFKVLDP